MQIMGRVVDFHVANKKPSQVLVQSPHGTLVVRRAGWRLLELRHTFGLRVEFPLCCGQLLCESCNFVFELLHAPVRRRCAGSRALFALKLA